VRHGYIRGWMKTNEKWQYRFYTLMPASYPNSTALKHIHPVIKEPGKKEYYIDEFTFDEDPFLTPERRKQPQENRGGNGRIRLKKENGLLRGERNIYLGKNIPGYPLTKFNKNDLHKTKETITGFTTEKIFFISSLIPHWE